MEHTRHRWGFVAAALVSANWACGDAGSSPASSAAQAPGSAGNTAGSGSVSGASAVPSPASLPDALPTADQPLLELSIDGRAQPMGARATLNVKEGEQAVQLSITGTDGGDDLLILSATFDGLDGTLGPHALPVSLPNAGDDTASASLAGLLYHSQAGEIDVTLAASGPLSGTFNLSMAEDAATPPSASGDGSAPAIPAVEPSADVLPLSGHFTGSWIFACQSYLPGHHVLVAGGQYCDNLQF